MTLRLVLVAHGLTDGMRHHTFGCHGDVTPPDADTVARVNESVAGYLRGDPRSVCSPSPAARDSARYLGWDDTKDEPAIEEIDFGAWSGSTLTDLQSEHPDVLGSWTTDPDFAPPGGESVRDHIERVGRWLTGLPSGERVAVVAHPSILRSAAAFALGDAAEHYWRIDCEPWSLLRLSSHGHTWKLRL